MTWFGPHLDEDQTDLVAMLDAVAADRGGVLADDDASVQPLVATLAELGVWTLGADESFGGGGADHVLTHLVLERLGRHWPALGWACVQAHAALAVIGGREGVDELVSQVHRGDARVAVVDASSPLVELDVDGDTVTGVVHRVDAAASAPHLLVLRGTDPALLVSPDGLVESEALNRTGLAGAQTRSVVVRAVGGAVRLLDDTPVGPTRTTLWLGGAAVAAGIAGGAVDDALAYTSERHQFGAPLTSLATVRQSLLDQAAQVGVALKGALATSADEVSAWAVVRCATETALDVTAAALQAHGGYGYLEEYPVERRLRDAVSLRAAIGAHSAAPGLGLSLVSA